MLTAELNDPVMNTVSNVQNVHPKFEFCGLCAFYKEGISGFVDLDAVASAVKSHNGTLIPLVKPKSYSVRVCGQDGTVYSGNEDQLEAWKDFYLPERMEMVVIGAIDDFPCDAFGLQLVLLLCEDGKVYAYDHEVLHLVARNVKELHETGLTFPGLESYNLGECFEDYTEEEYNEIMQSNEMKEMEEAHKKYRESLELGLLESLKELKRNQSKNVEEGWPKKDSDKIKQRGDTKRLSMETSNFKQEYCT